MGAALYYLVRSLTSHGGSWGADSSVAERNPVCTATQKMVFVTSADFGADLGGLAGADAKCQQAAVAVGLGGTFRAWLSDDLE